MNTKLFKHYSRPFMVIEHFVPNEYVAGCAHSSQDLWRVKVEDINKVGDYASDFLTGGELWYESNGIAGLQKTGEHPDRQVSGKQMSIPSNNIHDGYVYFNNPGRPGYFTNNYDITVNCTIVGEALIYGDWGNPNEMFHTGSNVYFATDSENVVTANPS